MSAVHRVFISYKHGAMTPVAQKFHNKLRISGPAMGLASSFLDASALKAGTPWRAEVEKALAEATRFVAFLEDDYWLSDECQIELRHAVDRWQKGEEMRLLFVKAGEIAPEWLVLDDAPAAGGTPADETKRQLKRVGDLQFLGPFDTARGQLVTLLPMTDPGLDAQLFQLMQRLHATLA